MPLIEAPASQVPTDAEYIIFYSSVDPATGRLWCPDCRDVDQLVRDTFTADGAPDARLVYVGQRHEWKRPAENPLRGEPWNVAGVPTIVKLKDGKEVARLVEGEIPEKLAALVRE
ncbi:hypothetical protein AURDEDRAFT_156207 [Auricularia subglabra TFB-10046 SS5]|nr:hypothetical protein AURDEDRAFT_156207 [Auricularia subglabra TFB-10046 SS5]